MYKESEIIELKREYTADIRKEIIAFANTDGGTIYVGIDDNGDIVGIDDCDALMLKIGNLVRDSIKPDITAFIHYDNLVEHDKNILKITVQRGTLRPYYIHSKGLKPSGVYVRQGFASVPASDMLIKDMIRDTDGDSYESARSLQQKLTFKRLKHEFDGKSIAFNDPQKGTLGITEFDDIYTNLGLLLSDQCPHELKIAVFQGTDGYIFRDRREIRGALLDQLYEAYEYIDNRNAVKATIEGLHRKDKRDYPQIAIREALLNMLVHRDYSYMASPTIGIYDNRIEFTSLGGLPPRTSLDDILLDGFSLCRNPKLANVFYRLELIEAYGTGLQKIMDAYKNKTVKPQIIVTTNAFKLILPNCNIDEPISEHNVPKISYQQEEQIINLVRDCGSIKRSDVDTELKVAQATSGRVLRRLVEKGRLKQIGKGRSIRYILSDTM